MDSRVAMAATVTGADVGSFADFATGYGTHLMRIAYALTGSQHDAADLAQDTLERVYLSWWRVKGDPAGYAHRVMVNQLKDHRRWWQRHPTTSLEVAQLEPAVGSDERRVDDRDQVVRALQALPAQQRKVVVLRHPADLSEAQTAMLLGISVGTVKSHAARALASLRDELRPAVDQDDAEHPTTTTASARGDLR